MGSGELNAGGNTEMDNDGVKILLLVLFELQVTVLNPKLSAH